jgi:hypothetical protein
MAHNIEIKNGRASMPLDITVVDYDTIKAHIRGQRQRVAALLALRSSTPEEEFLYCGGGSAGEGELTSADEDALMARVLVARRMLATGQADALTDV